MLAMIAGTAIAAATAIPVLPVIGGLTLVSLIPSGNSTYVLRAGVYTEVWTGEMVKNFTHEGTFLQSVPDYSRYVGNDVIHLVDVGAHPEVLINNTTYPLVPQTLGEDDIAISLYKFETVPTSITHDELYAISYPKIKAAHDLHRESLQMETTDYAAHAFAPNSHTTNTPVIETSGSARGDGRKRIVIADIISLKKAFDDAKFPKRGRTLVLNSDHVQDLLLVSQNFANQYQDIQEGKVLRLYGFEIHEYLNNPVYNGSTKVKKAYGAVSALDDLKSSFAFCSGEMFKAQGSIDAFLSDAKADVLNKRNLCSFNLRYVSLPKKAQGYGAIIDSSSDES